MGGRRHLRDAGRQVLQAAPRRCSCPAALSEVGSITLREEHDLLASSEGQEADRRRPLRRHRSTTSAHATLAARIGLAGSRRRAAPAAVDGRRPALLAAGRRRSEPVEPAPHEHRHGGVAGRHASWSPAGRTRTCRTSPPRRRPGAARRQIPALGPGDRRRGRRRFRRRPPGGRWPGSPCGRGESLQRTSGRRPPARQRSGLNRMPAPPGTGSFVPRPDAQNWVAPHVTRCYHSARRETATGRSGGAIRDRTDGIVPSSCRPTPCRRSRLLLPDPRQLVRRISQSSLPTRMIAHVSVVSIVVRRRRSAPLPAADGHGWAGPTSDAALHRPHLPRARRRAARARAHLRLLRPRILGEDHRGRRPRRARAPARPPPSRSPPRSRSTRTPRRLRRRWNSGIGSTVDVQAWRPPSRRAARPDHGRARLARPGRLDQPVLPRRPPRARHRRLDGSTVVAAKAGTVTWARLAEQRRRIRDRHRPRRRDADRLQPPRLDLGRRRNARRPPARRSAASAAPAPARVRTSTSRSSSTGSSTTRCATSRSSPRRRNAPSITPTRLTHVRLR